MSIVIRGMEMPENCEKCPFLIEEDIDFDICRQCGAGKNGYIHEADIDGFPDDCPLVELPEKHGRLIDGDALRSSFRESIDDCYTWAEECDSNTLMYARVSQSMGTFVEASLRTKAQPTVLEAEGEDRNE